MGIRHIVICGLFGSTIFFPHYLILIVLRVNEQRNILHEIRKRKANWIGHILRRNCLLKQVIEGKIKGEMEVARRRGRKRKKLLDDLKDRRGYSNLKEEVLERTMWRNRFGRGCSILQTGHITLSSTPDQQLESHSTKYMHLSITSTFTQLHPTNGIPDPTDRNHQALHLDNTRHLILRIQIPPNLQITFYIFTARNTTGSNHFIISWPPDDGHSGARNMLSKQ